METNPIARRLGNELRKWEEESKKPYGYEITPENDNNLLDLIGIIPGPPDTPYEGGKYKFTLKLNNYPFRAPHIHFITKVWHPNISHIDGTFCNMFEPQEWSTAININMIFLYIQALLSTPNIDKPLDDVVAGQYVKDHQLFVRTARFWNQKYGKRVLQSGQEFDELLEENVEEMSVLGCYEDRSIRALSEANWNIDEAVQLYHKQENRSDDLN